MKKTFEIFGDIFILGQEEWLMFNIYESNKPAISLNLELETMSYFCANRISSLHNIYNSYFENFNLPMAQSEHRYIKYV